MADIKWIKLSVNMFNDEKIKLIRTMPEGDAIIVVWVQLLCLAGKTNDYGSVYMGQSLYYSDEMLATICDQPVNVMRIALDTLDQFGLIERNDEGLIEIVNWEKHQNIEGMQRLKDGNAERQSRYYWRKKLVNVGIDPYVEGFTDNPEELKEIYDNRLTLGLTSTNTPEEDKRREEEDKTRIDKEQEPDKESHRSNVVVDDPKKNALSFYEHAGFGMLSPYVIEELEHWINDLNDELVTEALKITVENAKSPNLNYAKAIMKSWVDQQVKNLDDVKALNKQHTKSNEKEVPEEYANLF